MQRLVEEMRSEAFLAAHPVMQAAYAHYGLVVVHPFPDGNGRVARALASTFTYRAISMPIMILSEHKSAYLDALEAADDGDYQQFVDFMLGRSQDTIQLAAESIRGLSVPTSEESLAAINDFYFTKGGFTQQEVDEHGLAFLNAVLQKIREEVDKIRSERVRGQVSMRGGVGQMQQPMSAHRASLNGGQNLFIVFNSLPPVQASVGRQYDLFVPKNAGGQDDVLLMQTNRQEILSARMDELKSASSGVLQIRIALFAERIVREMLAELKSMAEQTRRNQF